MSHTANFCTHISTYHLGQIFRTKSKFQETQQIFTCSQSIETLEGVKYVQIEQYRYQNDVFEKVNVCW